MPPTVTITMGGFSGIEVNDPDDAGPCDGLPATDLNGTFSLASEFEPGTGIGCSWVRSFQIPSTILDSLSGDPVHTWDFLIRVQLGNYLNTDPSVLIGATAYATIGIEGSDAAGGYCVAAYTSADFDCTKPDTYVFTLDPAPGTGSPCSTFPNIPCVPGSVTVKF